MELRRHANGIGMPSRVARFVANAPQPKTHRPMLWPCAAIAAGAMLAIASPQADAQAFSIQSADREVAAFGTSYCPGCGENGEDVIFSNGQSIPSDQPGLFDESIFSVGSDAAQVSTVSSAQISGEGSIGIGYTGNNHALSKLLVDFTVPQTGTYQLSGDVRIGIDEFDTQAHVTLSSSAGDLLSVVLDFSGTSTFDEPLLLEAGTLYTLDASIAGSDGEGHPTDGSWSVNLVPEPSSALVLGGLLFAAAATRRKSPTRT